jgi:type I restriction enzyme R subunit
MSPFGFLQAEFPEVYDEANKALDNALSDPRTSCFYSRRTVELAARWAFRYDPSLSAADRDTLSDLLNDPTFKRLMDDKVFKLAKEAVRLGNNAVHDNDRVSQRDSITSLSHLFQFTYWFARTYCRGVKPAEGLVFDPRRHLTPSAEVEKASAEQLRELEEALQRSEIERQVALEAVADRGLLEAELTRLRAEVAEAKKFAAATPDNHDYDEKETRDFFIDLLLAEAGWPFGTGDDPIDGKDVEFEVFGMPNEQRVGYVDYVLWGDDGLPLGLVEAKRTRKSPLVGQQQAVLYANCLEEMFGQRPVIFYSNGFQHWIWDDTNYPPRHVQGFYTKDELALLVQRRSTRLPLSSVGVNSTIVERHYQRRAIKRIGESFEIDKRRKALVVMATGAGKTRTVIALADVLTRTNWAKRVLFLADRTALVNQAMNAFKAFMPDSAPVNLTSEKDVDSRVYVSTYPTMMNLINSTENGLRRFGPGHFDLVIIDEAHRSVFKKYQAIFDYFDALLVGLTATPKDEVEKNTYDLFDLQTGMPTDVYSLEEAVADGFLVPYKAISVPLKFPNEGIKYENLTPEEQQLWDDLDWGEEDPLPPDFVDSAAVNKWLFNSGTVDKVLETLMLDGIKVDGGDTLGKTIIFAKNQAHADFIAERFDINYPHLEGKFARIITYKVNYAQTLIDDFSVKGKDPSIAVSVDMLDTGIDVPEVVNLVFFKQVRSKTKFWQMLGRGTRLCVDLFAPGVDKQYFRVFDFCMNFEFFSQNPKFTEGASLQSVSERRFKARLVILQLLEENQDNAVRADMTSVLHDEVRSMNIENFIVRPHRQLVERFTKGESWNSLSDDDFDALATQVANLPTELPSEPEETRRFDVLMLQLEIALLKADTNFEKLANRVKLIAKRLSDVANIPVIRAQLEFLEEIQTDGWWEGITLSMLEEARRKIRDLVPFMPKVDKTIIYTTFDDEFGEARTFDFTDVPAHSDFEDFRAKALAFLKEHHGETAVKKIRQNWPITSEDMNELRRILIVSGIGTSEDFQRAQEQSGSFGLFVRSLVGLDRVAAKDAFAGFLERARYSANQIEFVNLIIDDLSQNGVIELSRFYEAPFTSIAPQGPNEIFSEEEIGRLAEVLEAIKKNAMAA